MGRNTVRLDLECMLDLNKIYDTICCTFHDCTQPVKHAFFNLKQLDVKTYKSAFFKYICIIKKKKCYKSIKYLRILTN